MDGSKGREVDQGAGRDQEGKDMWMRHLEVELYYKITWGKDRK